MLETYFDEVSRAEGCNGDLDAAIGELKREFTIESDFEYRARGLVESMALVLQASILVQHAPDAVSSAFCISRLARARPQLFGAMRVGVDCARIINRAFEPG